MTFNEDTEKIIKATVLKNALEYKGKSRVDTVIAKVIGSQTKSSNNLKNLIPKITEIVHRKLMHSLWQIKKHCLSRSRLGTPAKETTKDLRHTYPH